MIQALQQDLFGRVRDGKQSPGTSRPVLPAFARHETFHPRFGWLKKGFEAAKQDPEVFLREDAPITLGVGKNMARAVRYWCHAAKVLADSPIAGQRSQASIPSTFGECLLGEEHGWDPYLEDTASLWLLHWKLLQPPCEAAAWHFAFSTFAGREFSAEDLTAALAEYVARDFPNARAVHASLRKDVNCILRMYTEQRVTASVSEDTLSCPFAELGLIQPSPGTKRFAFNVGTKPNLPAPVVVACCLEYIVNAGVPGHTVPLSRLLGAPMSPGMAFKLSEGALYQAIEEVTAAERSVSLSDTAGLVQFSFDDEPTVIAGRLLDQYYASRFAGVI